MRLSDLLHSAVVDTAGKAYGSVDDVRLIQDGPMQGASASFRVEGLVIGRGALGVRLGFHRGKVKGPWPLKVLFTRLESRARYVPWEQVTSYDDGHVVFSGEPTDVPGDA
jgi:sporulation protein YlmC with PRC-barrel domain